MLSVHENKTEFQNALLAWFQEFKRNFPWRETSNPYNILVAEKLLQQTAARDGLVRAYLRLLDRYPTPPYLAEADVSDLAEIIQPLGFSFRAKELQALGEILVSQYMGIVPASRRQLIALPGVGEYAARAVLSFAYEEDIAIVDTNVARLLYRLYGWSGPMPNNPARKRTLIVASQALLPPGNSRNWNLAILDLCALVCTPGRPKCDCCPISAFCCYGTSH